MIRILIVDDHEVVRRGLRTFLELEDDMDVVGEAGDGAACLAVLGELAAADLPAPDVILLDLVMPGMDGVATLQRLRADGVAARVLVVTSYPDPQIALPAVRAGAAGIVYKNVDPAALAQAIRSVHAGHVLLPPDVAAALLTPQVGPDRLAALTARERDVLAEIARGRSNREIARALSMAEKTVKTHVSNVLMKLGVADRTQAAIFAVRHSGG